MASSKILVSLSDQLMIGLLQAELREVGHSVRVVKTGPDVVEQSVSWQPDALILSPDLPQMNGLEVATALRSARGFNAPILFILRTDDQARPVRELDLPGVEMMIGSLDLFKLRAQVEHLLSLPRVTPPAWHAPASESAEGLPESVDGFHDSMTGLYSREFVTDRLKYEAGRSARYQTRITLLLFGVDNYGPVQERFGIASANAAVVGVANVLRGASRSVDVIGRYASDRFLMIAPQTDEAGARRFVERILQRLRQFKFDLPPQALPIRVSVGIATASTSSFDEAMGLLQRAETAYAQARSASRNHISVG